MRVIARRTLLNFAESCAGQSDHTALVNALDSWYRETRSSNWSNSADLRRSFAHASIVDAERVVFNIKGNDYRLIAALDYKYAAVYIKWIGTHADYDQIDARTVEYDP